MSIPLTVIPLVVFNVFVFWFAPGTGGDPWLAPLFTVEMPSAARFTLTAGDALLIAGIGFLFLEVLKATRTGSATLADHMLSMVVFVVHLVEFLVVAAAAHPVFAILTVIAFVDVVAGFSVTIAGARRDVAFDREGR